MQQALRAKGPRDRVRSVFQLPDHQGSMSTNGGDVPPAMLKEKSVKTLSSFTFYTYSVAGIPPEERWKPTGISDIFFDSLEEARNAVLALRKDVMADPEMEWATTVLEKMETIPLDRAAVLALLNHGPGGVVARCEIVETFGPKT